MVPEDKQKREQKCSKRYGYFCEIRPAWGVLLRRKKRNWWKIIWANQAIWRWVNSKGIDLYLYCALFLYNNTFKLYFPFLNTYIKLCGSVEWGHVNKPSTFVLTILHYLISSTYSCPGIYNSVPIIHHLLLHNVCVLKVNMCQVTLIWKVHLNRTKKKNHTHNVCMPLKVTLPIELSWWRFVLFGCFLFCCATCSQISLYTDVLSLLTTDTVMKIVAVFSLCLIFLIVCILIFLYR